jgi:sugar lactone lactonase YvrE
MKERPIKYLNFYGAGFIFTVLGIFIILANSSFAQMSIELPQYSFEQPGFFGIPSTMAYDAIRNRLAICDKGRNQIYIFNLEDQTYETVGEAYKLNIPIGVALNAKGDIYVSQNKTCFLLVFKFGIETPETLLLASENPADKILPARIYIENDQHILVTDQSKPIVYRFDASGKMVAKITDNLRSPNGLFVKPDGHIFIADRGIDPIIMFSDDCEFIRRLSIPEPLSNKKSFSAAGLAVDQSGSLYTINTSQSKVTWYDPAVVNRQEWAPTNQPFFPIDICIDRFNRIYVLDSGNGKVWILENVK